MNVIDSVRQLGAAIQQDQRYIRYAKAKLANDNNDELQKAIGEFNVIRLQLDGELELEDRDEKKVSELNEKLRSLYSSIMSSPEIVEYNSAKDELDNMLNDINSIIIKSVEGEDPATCEAGSSSCGGCCSSCSGCH